MKNHFTSKIRGINSHKNWKLIISIIQTVIFFVTFIGAFYIGIKQNEINNQLLELNNVVSVEVGYDINKLDIFNKGKNNIWLWGTKIGEEAKNIESEPRLITPGGFYYLFTDIFEAKILREIPDNGSKIVNLDIFIKDGRDKKYIIKNLLFIEVKNKNITINSQTTSINQVDW